MFDSLQTVIAGHSILALVDGFETLVLELETNAVWYSLRRWMGRRVWAHPFFVFTGPKKIY